MSLNNGDGFDSAGAHLIRMCSFESYSGVRFGLTGRVFLEKRHSTSSFAARPSIRGLFDSRVIPALGPKTVRGRAPVLDDALQLARRPTTRHAAYVSILFSKPKERESLKARLDLRDLGHSSHDKARLLWLSKTLSKSPKSHTSRDPLSLKPHVESHILSKGRRRRARAGSRAGPRTACFFLSLFSRKCKSSCLSPKSRPACLFRKTR